MNYSKIYSDLMRMASTRTKPDCYTERHHKTPKCAGGDDSIDNIVYLTAREHYVAHWLLAKMYDGQGSIGMKMAYAFNMMHNDNKARNGARYRTSRGFESMRKLWSKNHHAKLPENRLRQSENSKRARAEKPESFLFLHTDEYRSKLSEIAKTRLRSLTPEQLSERMAKSTGSCDHIARGKSISAGKKGKIPQNGPAEELKYGQMSDDEFSTYIEGRPKNVRSRMTNRRNAYLRKQNEHGNDDSRVFAETR
jgi:hypothetical protein